MKKLILLALMAVLGLQAQAQIGKTYSGWSTFALEYMPCKFTNGGESFTGLAFTFTNALPLTQSEPVFFEWGLGGQYSFYDKDNVKMKMASVKVPLNIVYDFAIPGSTISIDPYLGVHFRVNVWGEEKVEVDGRKQTINLFDKDEGDCNRFQVGGHIGLKARFNKAFFLGASYGFDFSKFGGDSKVNEVTLAVGLVF